MLKLIQIALWQLELLWNSGWLPWNSRQRFTSLLKY